MGDGTSLWRGEALWHAQPPFDNPRYLVAVADGQLLACQRGHFDEPGPVLAIDRETREVGTRTRLPAASREPERELRPGTDAWSSWVDNRYVVVSHAFGQHDEPTAPALPALSCDPVRPAPQGFPGSSSRCAAAGDRALTVASRRGGWRRQVVRRNRRAAARRNPGRGYPAIPGGRLLLEFSAIRPRVLVGNTARDLAEAGARHSGKACSFRKHHVPGGGGFG